MVVEGELAEADTQTPMSAGEARQYVDWIKGALENARTYLLELYEREGWRALGYASWRTCIKEEFGWSEQHGYRVLDAAVTERTLLNGPKAKYSPIGENLVSEPIPESQLREIAPLAKADPEAARALWRVVQEEAAEDGVKVTATQVREAVDAWVDAGLPLTGDGDVATDGDGAKTEAAPVAVATPAELPVKRGPGPKPDPDSKRGRERAAQAARKAEVLRAHAQANRTVTALERSAQALEQLARAVEGVLEREPEMLLTDLLPEQAAQATRDAARMAEWWGRVAALCAERAGAAV